MLIIRKSQIDILEKYMVKQFEDRMIVHLQLNFPDQTKDRDESSLRHMIQGGIEKASKFRVKFESDVQTFIEYMTIFGHDFETNPELSWIANILYDKSLNPGEKMEALDRHLRNRGLNE